MKDITDILAENNTLEKCTVLDPEKAALEDLCLVHSRNYVESIRKTESMNIVIFIGYNKMIYDTRIYRMNLKSLVQAMKIFM